MTRLLNSLRLKLLLRRLQSAPSSVAVQLGKLGDKRAVPALIELLSGRESYSTDIVEALGQIGDCRAVDPLLDKMGRVFTGEERVLIAAQLQLLGNAGWLSLVKGDNEDWSRIAVSGEKLAYIPLSASLSITAYIETKLEAIARLGDKRTIEPVLDALCSDWQGGSIRKQAAATLTRLGEPQWERIITGQTGDWEALGRTRDTRLVQALSRTVNEIETELNKLSHDPMMSKFAEPMRQMKARVLAALQALTQK